jgi:hypothetical protein
MISYDNKYNLKLEFYNTENGILRKFFVGIPGYALNEWTRKQLINKSKYDKYDRFSRRTSIDKKDVKISRVGLLELTARSVHLDIYFTIKDYKVSVRFINFMNILRKYAKYKKYKGKIRPAVTDAFNFALEKSDIEIACTCPDFKYRFAHAATKNKFIFGDEEDRPSNKTNPNTRGAGCKHILKVISAPSDWKSVVITSVINAIKYDPSILDKDYKEE